MLLWITASSGTRGYGMVPRPCSSTRTAVSRASAAPLAWQLELLAPASSSPQFLLLTWGFPHWKGSGHGSRHLLQELGSAPGQDSCWRQEEERDLLGMPPHSQPVPGPTTRDRAHGGRSLVICCQTPPCRPSLTMRYSLATTHMKCRSEDQSFPLVGLQSRGLSSVCLSRGQEQLVKSTSHTQSWGDGMSLRTLPLQPHALELEPWLLCYRIARGFQQVLICPVHPWISLNFKGKHALKSFWGRKSQRPGPPRFPQGSRGAEPHGVRSNTSW